MVFQDVIIGIFIGVVLGALVAMTAFVRHCKNTPSTDED
jgi:gas vesicle protein